MNLPFNWVKAPLSDLCEKISDGSHNPPRAQSSGLPMLSARNVSQRKIIFDEFRLISEIEFSEEDRRTRVKAGDVLLTIVGAIGRTAVVPAEVQPFTLQRSVAVLKPRLCDPRFISYALEAPAVQNYLQENSKGTAQKGIYLKALGSVEIPVSPLTEQKRIANKLDAIFTRVDAVDNRLARVAPLIKRFRQSVLATATSGRLTRDWRSSPTENCVQDETLPKGWRRLALKNIGRVSTGSTPPKAHAEFYGGEVPFVKPGDLDKGVILMTDDTLTETGSLEARMVRAGAVFVSCIGNLGKVGVAGLPMAFNQQINAVEFDPTIASDQYGYFACMTLAPWLYENSSATTIAIVNKGKFEQAEINVPPLVEQTEIARRVEILFAFANRLEARLQAAQTAVNRLTPSLLAKAFRGELVTQDPNDEPANELLKRLTAIAPATVTRKKRSKITS